MTVTVFEYLILISRDFFTILFSFRFLLRFCLVMCLFRFLNTSKFVKITPLRFVFSTLFSMFREVIKQGPLQVISMLQGYRGSSNIHFHTL